ncbi:predicted protein [Naegleria gruberi]|uniref:Predicted protein n=1 Tax=Naegleria gruberi TaxID=5762 RepID=D2VYD7_NAEGR|nr:uncharacterized protein NAEGRDRAFT_74084 [Naegleria gruberi]EFC38189.1 predicted protein [Naegleria gruberi]|eukprot:XP_002670933.1 predicted protein [Naegleria gruberi strain NEG-M]
MSQQQFVGNGSPPNISTTSMNAAATNTTTGNVVVGTSTTPSTNTGNVGGISNGAGTASLKTSPNDLLLNLRKYTNKLLEINGTNQVVSVPSNVGVGKEVAQPLASLSTPTLNLNQNIEENRNNQQIEEERVEPQQVFKIPQQQTSRPASPKRSESLVIMDDQISDIESVTDNDQSNTSKTVVNYRDLEVKKCYDIIFKLRNRLAKEKEKNDQQERRKEDSTKMLGKLIDHYKSENSRLIQQLDLLRRDSDAQIEEQLHQMNDLRISNFTLSEEINILRNSVNIEKQKGDQDIERHIREKSKTQSELIECKRENSKLRETIMVLEENIKKAELNAAESVKNFEEIEIPSLKRKCGYYEKTISDLEKKLDEIRKDQERSVNQHVERFKSKEAVMGETIKRLEEDLKKQRESMKQNSNSSSEEKKQLEIQLKEQVNLNDETRLELANLKSSLEDIEVNMLNHLIQEHEELIIEVSQMDAFMTEVFSVKSRKEIKRLVTENLELKNQLSLMNEQYEINKKQLQHATLELDELKSSFNKGDQVLSQLENQRKTQSERHRIELEELRTEMRNFTISQKAEKENLLDLLDNTKTQLDTCQHKMEQMQLERSDGQKEVQYLRKRNSELETQLLNAESDRQRLVSEVSNLNCTLDQLRDEVDAKNDENRKIVEQSRSSMQSIQVKLNRDQQIYQKSEYDWNQKVKHLNDMVLQAEYNLSEYKKKYKEEISSFNNDLIMRQQQIESLQTDVQRMKQEGMSITAQNKKDLDVREQEIQKIKREKQQLEHSIVQKEREKDSFKLRLEMMERELSRLKSQYNVK